MFVCVWIELSMEIQSMICVQMQKVNLVRDSVVVNIQQCLYD